MWYEMRYISTYFHKCWLDSVNCKFRIIIFQQISNDNIWQAARNMELEELETNEKKESGKVENVTPKIIETGIILLIDQVAAKIFGKY